MSGFLVFDCETTGLPVRRNLSVRDVEGWPRLVQLAWAVYDSGGRLEAAECRIVRPDGFLIPADSTRIHGISHDRALAEGETAGDVLGLFARALDSPFDAVIAELIRANLPSRLFERPGLCTMKTTTNLLCLPGPFGFKWPKLEELYLYLFEAGYEGAHNAALDVEATARCFFELLRRGHYPRP
jgi:DNA polymerase-3 subunit epsilon